MEYIAKDFENLLLNVYKHDIGTDLLKVFPILSKYEEFKVIFPVELDIEKVIRYVVFAFDPNSPLLAINDITERRIEAAELAGFTQTSINKKGAGQVEKMIKSIIPKVNHMIIRYCMLQGDTDYTVMVAYEDSLFKELKRLSDFGTAEAKKAGANEKKNELINNISNLRKSINELKEVFFSNNIDYFLSRSLSEFSESKRVELSPEFYAEKLKGWDNVSRYWKKVRA